MSNLFALRNARFLALTSLLGALACGGCASEDEGASGDVGALEDAATESPEADLSAVPPGPVTDVFNLVNQARATARKCGTQQFQATAALRYDDRLGAAAQGHSADMAARNYFSHTSPEGLTMVNRVQAQGYNFSRLGENIAAGQPTPAQVVNAWLQSPGHCANIMNPAFRDIGIGRAQGGSFGIYWTQDFGTPL
jgi:uncharacterized protein YkwD